MSMSMSMSMMLWIKQQSIEASLQAFSRVWQETRIQEQTLVCLLFRCCQSSFTKKVDHVNDSGNGDENEEVERANTGFACSAPFQTLQHSCSKGSFTKNDNENGNEEEDEDDKAWIAKWGFACSVSPWEQFYQQRRIPPCWSKSRRDWVGTFVDW